MKISEIARIRQTGPVTSYKLVTVKNLAETIEAHPGLSAAGIASAMGRYDQDAKRKISVALCGMRRTSRPKIRSVYQDGRVRFYPVNYRISTDPKATAKAGAVSQITPERLQQFAWETGSDLAPLKAFWDWHTQGGAK